MILCFKDDAAEMWGSYSTGSAGVVLCKNSLGAVESDCDAAKMFVCAKPGM